MAASTDPEQRWAAALRAALGLLLPVDCVGCGAPDRAVCADCRRALADRPRRVRLVGGVRTDVAFEYEGLVRVLLLELKLRSRVDVAGPLAGRFAALVHRALAEAPPGTVLLRVPPSARGRRRRGFDPVVLLLRRGGAPRGRPLVRARRDRGGTGQKERSATERVRATVGSLVARDVAGRTVVLVDDVVTTGVTMAEAVRAVRAAGGSVVRCVAVASVEDRVAPVHAG
ncbi:phosphoribosyltransferase [Curtobacterium sp. 'Ferrero']|uniref:ComF family protein n=1 Tax=Curtobacterium sp. 'Ferrero' TaxID=2033654 RepID=UPI000BC57573|nr:phosphoribosyltransferase family protein [Curtobacterium sp. 'Ferrero']PCN49317.1 phosphoribosyltransferase [Curtobacterium sp. 'Ferrero']